MTAQPLMTSTETPKLADAITTCHLCGGVALANQHSKYPFCFKCLFACRDCGTFLPLDQDVRYCDDCVEDRIYVAWDSTQP